MTMRPLMMNLERLRASLRRLFTNDWNEIVGEQQTLRFVD